MQAVTKYWPLYLLLVLQVLFFQFPEIDIAFTHLFFDSQQGFFLSDNSLVKFSYTVFKYLHIWLLVIMLWLWLASWWWAKFGEKELRRTIVFLVVVMAFGPGLVVNEVFKAESGRARPATVEAFGGEKTFTPAFVASDQCAGNCSFVSGHAGLGFYFLAFAWAFGDRRWLYYGALIGGLVGLGRITQGAHFLSDVIFGYAVVYASALLCARWILGRWQVEKAES